MCFVMFEKTRLNFYQYRDLTIGDYRRAEGGTLLHLDKQWEGEMDIEEELILKFSEVCPGFVVEKHKRYAFSLST